MGTKCSQLVDALSGNVVAMEYIDEPPLHPAADWPLQTKEHRTITIDFSRTSVGDQNTPEGSKVVTANMQCNTCHQFLGTDEQALSSGYYAVKYCAKDPIKLCHISPVLQTVVSSVA